MTRSFQGTSRKLYTKQQQRRNNSGLYRCYAHSGILYYDFSCVRYLNAFRSPHIASYGASPSRLYSIAEFSGDLYHPLWPISCHRCILQWKCAKLANKYCTWICGCQKNSVFMIKVSIRFLIYFIKYFHKCVLLFC